MAQNLEAAIAQQDQLNRFAAGYYGIAIAGLISIPVVIHALRTTCGGKSPKLLRPVLRPVHRIWTAVTFGDILALPMQIMLALAFIGINIGLTAWKMNWSNQAYLGSRLGWLALCNMCLAVFLGLKNTPLALLAAQTYRDLNAVHRFCGYTTVIEVILHGAVFTSGLYNVHAVYVLKQAHVYAGWVSGVAMVLIALTATSLFRKRFYEAFYLLHVFLVAVAIVSMALHQPWFAAGGLIVTVIAAGLWAADRAVRFIVWSRNAIHGYCTITPLPLGATRVVFHKPVRAAPGSHGLLWLPSIRLFQQHPFSILNEGQTEFVITARKGFTKSLYEKACQNPGMQCRASLDGPYGICPNLALYDKCLIIAGGSGATFAMSLASEWMRITPVADTTKTLHFVWVVRSSTHLHWLSDQLQQLKGHPRVNVILHVTGADEATKDLADGQAVSGDNSPALSSEGGDSVSLFTEDVEKVALRKEARQPPLNHRHSRIHHFFHHGRPVIDDVFRQALIDIKMTDRLLVTGSGPSRLLTDIRAATAEQIKIKGPSVQLHIEEYEW